MKEACFGHEANPCLINNQQAFDTLCEVMYTVNVVALDTEFIRERTFYPKLALLQIALVGHEQQYLVDVLNIQDWSGFCSVLKNKTIVKVLHGCTEDLEIFQHQFAVLPELLFDTQIAQRCLGGEELQLGYNRLVEKEFAVVLNSGPTRSDWLQRPLADYQMSYAANDVKYLPALYELLKSRLEAQARLAWHDEEVSAQKAHALADTDFDRLYLRIANHWRLCGHALLALQRLAIWREQVAEREDLPRGFVITDTGLYDLARCNPKDRKGLSRLHSLKPAQLKRYGAQCLEVLADAAQMPLEKELVVIAPLSKVYRPLIAQLKQSVQGRSDDLGVRPEFLVSKKQLIALVRAHQDRQRGLSGQECTVLKTWQTGWRFSVIVEELQQQIECWFVENALGSVIKNHEDS